MTNPVELDLVQLLARCIVAVRAAQSFVLLDILGVAKEQQSASPAASATFDESTPNDEDEENLMKTITNTEAAQLIAKHVNVDVKGVLASKKEKEDLVTSADTLVQFIVMYSLEKQYATPSSEESSGGLPFTIIGEESPPSADKRAEYIAAAEKCMNQYAALSAIPHAETALFPLLSDRTRSSSCVVKAASLLELQSRVLLYLDPIDGTNAFVLGCLQVPFTLLGITLDGVPIGGVMNRVFASTPQGKPLPESLSYGLMSPNRETSFLVIEGKCFPTPMTTITPTRDKHPREETEKLIVTFSKTSEDSVIEPYLAALEPMTRRPERGAGFKLYLVIKNGLEQSEDGRADVFVSPPKAIKKWDTCAPHALLRLRGGDILDLKGNPIRYVNPTQNELDTGVVAFSTNDIRQILQQRYRWASIDKL